jgi:signal transduction histidine kinase/CheY-like chemotaxis protein
MEVRSIATRYSALVVALLCVALIASGALQAWNAHRDRQAALEALQREQAQGAAAAVARFVDDILRSLDWATLSAATSAANDIEPRRVEFLKLLRLERAITTATLVDAGGREVLRVSHIETDRLSSGIDMSREPAFTVAQTTRAHFSDVRFVAETEPYLTVAAPAAARDGSVVIADVNLKFVRTVVSGITVGHAGYAYVVDGRGRLVAHPEMSLVLQMSDMSRLPQVRAATAAGAALQGFAADATAPDGAAVLAAYAKVAPLNWTVFVEQPRAAALAPLRESIERSAAILIVALALAVTAGVLAARRLVAPMGELRRGAQRFGAGDLAHRIDVRSGDELQELAAHFNSMGERLSETYSSLERRVQDRTRELNERSRQLADANQAKSRLLAAASHDLRQPMHALALFVGQLQDSKTTDERLVLTKRIERAVGSLSELLDQLLDLSKLGAGAVQAVSHDFAIGDLLAAIEAEFVPLAHAKGIALRVRPCDAWLRTDPVLVRRIVSNLVANAIRYTAQGGVLVGCRKRAHALVVAVWDTGCGIPEDRRDDVFLEFVQLAGAEHRGADGSPRGLGLGLSIVARLSKLLGSEVVLRSTVGRGSMFAFELPLGLQNSDAPEAFVPASVSALRGTFALVIDDDEAARDGMCGLLGTWGCVTLAATSSDDAVAQLAAHDRSPELIVCDHWLTHDTGLEAIEAVRAAIGAGVPAVLVTAETSRAVLLAAQAAGIPLLHKPVSPLKLRALLAQLLQPVGGERRIAA